MALPAENIIQDVGPRINVSDSDAFSAASPFAATLMPLLKALHWHGDLRDVAEAVPHFADSFDLVDLRNVLVLLGFESTPHKIALSQIDARLCPCLFVEDDGSDRAYVILERNDDILTVIDQGDQFEITLDETKRKGTAYFFTQIDSTTQFGAQNTSWFHRTLIRFRRIIMHLLVMTLVINLMSASVPLFVMTVYDKVIGNGSVGTLPYLLAGIMVVLGADLILRTLKAQLIGVTAGRIDYLLGAETLNRILALPPSFTERSSVSAQISRIREFESIRDFFTGPLAQTVLDLPFSLMFIGIIAILAGPIALVPVVMIIVLLVFGAIYMPRTQYLSKEAGKAAVQRQSFLIEATQNLRSIKAAAAEDVWRERYRLLSSQTVAAQLKSAQRGATMQTVTQAMTTMSAVAVLGFGAMSVLAGTMTIGALIATMALVWRVLSPFHAAFLAYTRFDDIRKSVAQINQLMTLKPERQTDRASLLSRKFEGKIEFNRVSFRYSADTDPALIGAQFAVEKGEFVSIIGPNGSGKSTVLKLIVGLYQPQGGAISVDGLDLRQADPVALRRQIAYVPQGADLFYGTIAQNLRLADPTASDERLIEVTKLTGAWDIIKDLPNGINTRVGDSLVKQLPTGFVQRLIIARALTRDAKILLLDEPATSLDHEGDRMLMQLLGNLKGKVTIVMVSHRPSHIRLADKVIVLHRGFIEYTGPGDQALAFASVLQP